MAFVVNRARVSPNSATLQEARNSVFDLFRQACRSIPKIMDIYILDDVADASQLRSAISAQIRKNAHITNPKVIDMLVFKGMEELGNIKEHAKQRHHVIGQYVLGRDKLIQDSGKKDKQKKSEFLKQFEVTNYF